MNKKYADDSYQDYFTNADDIRHTMVELLGDVRNQKIIEPCFGEGAFLKDLRSPPSSILAIDIDERHFERKLDVPNVQYLNADFIDLNVCPELYNFKLENNTFDATICNPPYGLKFSKEYRKLIKKRFPMVYARESYALFFYFTLNKIRPEGRYVFIMPDTFLTSTNLKYMRDFMLKEACPSHIIQFKSKRFESVNFGYGNMCIIAGIKKQMTTEDRVEWIDATGSNAPLFQLLSQENEFISGEELINTGVEAWTSPSVKRSIKFNRQVEILENIAECRTGIYTGNNTVYCGYDERNPPKRLNGHPVNWAEVCEKPNEIEITDGVTNGKSYVPLVRGGHRGVFEKTKSCIKWTQDAISFYDKDPKARLQNREFYFQKGIAIPMVTSGRLSASEFENSIFDQGVVGIFAKCDDIHNFLLIYLNHEFSTKLKSLIAPGANNSANYLKKLKVPKLSGIELQKASKIVEKSKENGWESTFVERDEFIKSVI